MFEISCDEAMKLKIIKLEKQDASMHFRYVWSNQCHSPVAFTRWNGVSEDEASKSGAAGGDWNGRVLTDGWARGVLGSALCCWRRICLSNKKKGVLHAEDL